MAKFNVPTEPVDRELAQNVVNDIWDMFGVLTREQMRALQTYFESLTAQGILVFPQYDNDPGVAEIQPDQPVLTEDRLGAEASHPEATTTLNQTK